MTILPEGQTPAEERPAAPPRPAAEALRPLRDPVRPQRSRRSRSQIVIFLNFLVSCVVLALLAAGVAVYFGSQEFEAAGPSTADGVILVKPKTGVGEIGANLEREGLITSALVFQGGVALHGAQYALKPGEYAVKAGASMHDIMDVIRLGKSIEYKVTIPEGFTVDQAWQRIATDPVLAGDMPATPPPEGSLLANTRRFMRGQTRQEMVKFLVADQAKLVNDIWLERDDNLPVDDVNQFVTLASIVEKETGIAAERPRVAAVFINRLNKGMRLQSDPTVIYGLFGGKGKPSDRPITQADLKNPTPYNTYLVNGLPPAPIANPGRAALEAVAHPARTDDLYFVADGTGGHVFAPTYKEHLENVAKWRKVEKRAGDGAAPEDDAAAAPGDTTSE